MSPARFRCANSLCVSKRSACSKEPKYGKKKGRNVIGVGFEPTPPKRLVPKTSALDHSAIQPFSMPKKGCSCRGSNPGPSAHKTEALPTAPQELAVDAKRCLRWVSNPRPWDYETHALPTAPQRLENGASSGNRTRATSLATRYHNH